MKKTLVLLFIFLSVQSYSQDFENGFNFKIPFYDSIQSDFLPRFEMEPIGPDDFITTDESGNFIRNGQPIRFFGGNCTTQGAFPLKGEAVKVAAHMRKLGINIIRFHHIDNPWSNGSLFYNMNGTRTLQPVLLDRLDYFIYQLKQHGIYVNMNLNVSRTFEVADGVEAADSLSDFGKGLTLFNRHMINLQKEYARQLLGHVNPYLGVPLAEDPVLAMVEVVNENSLFRNWYGGQLKPLAQGGTMPMVYSLELDSLWHDFLAHKYENNDRLMHAWETGSKKGDTLYFDNFESGLNTQVWKMEEHEGADATFSLNSSGQNNEVLVETIKQGSQSWHITFKNVGNSIQKDSVYELRFKAKADTRRKMSAGFQRDNSPWTYYDGRFFTLEPYYQEYKVIFKAPETNQGNLRIWFRFEFENGKFYIDDVLFKEISILGLEIGESLAENNVTRLDFPDIHNYSVQRIRDLTEFYTHTTTSFLTEMKIWLKDSIGVKAPLAGSNWFVGPEEVYVQNTMDYIDNHSYWDHPHFPNEPWSSTDWRISNTSMLSGNGTTIENLFSGLSVRNKPYTVSEYNHAYPNRYQSEMLPVITSYLSFHGADGIMFFTYSGSWNWDRDMNDGYFDLHRNNMVMAGFPLFSFAYRNYLLDEAPQTLVVNYRDTDIYEMPLNAENSWGTHVPYNKALAYNNRIELTFDGEKPSGISELPAPSPGPYSLNGNQVYWSKNGLFQINTPGFISITGFPEQTSGSNAGLMEITSADQFATVSWLSLSDSALDVASRSVLYVGTRQKNSYMTWDGINTIHNNWGRTPSLIEPMQLSLKMKNSSAGLAVYPLDPTGKPVPGKVHYFATGDNGFSTVNLNTALDQTILYGIETVSDWKSTGAGSFQNHGQQVICYPNPASEYVNFEISAGKHDPFDLAIYDATGKLSFYGHNQIQYRIPVQDLKKGIYLYRITGVYGTSTGKFHVR